MGAVLGSITSLLLVRAPIDAANAAFPWAVGSLNARPATPVTLLGYGLAGCLPLALPAGRRLTVPRLSDSVAAGLGVRVRAVRLGALAVAVVCAGLAVAVGGPLGMAALLAPEAARRICGPHGVPVLGSALAGATLVLLADTAGRTFRRTRRSPGRPRHGRHRRPLPALAPARIAPPEAAMTRPATTPSPDAATTLPLPLPATPSLPTSAQAAVTPPGRHPRRPRGTAPLAACRRPRRPRPPRRPYYAPTTSPSPTDRRSP
ncbi:iron chelate uptake ABC transporter family permease subunit [Streptomyces collinus]|uniref:iron chelate uptake ABC transporter family permease subunit n=1 Tax=Streptomyces collinus TaxID=42684 RepID=UPI0037ABE902